MTEISERYARLGDAFATKIAAVPEQAWAHPSPCDEWTARDVVNHVINTQGMFLGLVGRQLGDIPGVDDDPLAAWNAARSVVQGDLEDPVAFAQAIQDLLDDEGVWIVEMSYMPLMLAMNSFDTICHEHLEYYSLSVLETIMARAGLRIFRLSLNWINGGSIRCSLYSSQRRLYACSVSQPTSVPSSSSFFSPTRAAPRSAR